MKVQLLIEKALPLQSGVSRNSGNEWRKQDYIGKTTEQYPKTICFGFFGEAIDSNKLEVGSVYDVDINIESRSFVDRNGVERWSTNVNAYSSTKVANTAAQSEQPSTTKQQAVENASSQFYPQPTPQPTPTAEPQPDPELPF